MKSLQEYMTAARNRKQVLDEKDLRELIDRSEIAGNSSMGPWASDRSIQSRFRGRAMKIIAIAVMATAVGTMLYVDDGVDTVRHAAPAQIKRSDARSASAEEHHGSLRDIEKSGAASPREVPPVHHGSSTVESGMVVQSTEQQTVQRRGDNNSGPRTVVTTKEANGMAGVRFVTLTPDELAHIGVAVDSIAVWMTWKDSEEKPLQMGIINNGIIVPDEGHCLIELERVGIPHVSPVLITDDLGVRRGHIFRGLNMDSAIQAILDTMANGADKERMRDILEDEWVRADQESLHRRLAAGKLVGILVRTDRSHIPEDAPHRQWRTDLVIWYEPTSELLSLLPDRVRMQLGAEVMQVESLDNSPQSPARAASVVAGKEPYLDILRSASGAVRSTALYPNPARGKAMLKFTLSELRRVTVTINDIKGRLIREIIRDMKLPAGEDATTMIDLAGLDDGIYLIAVTTDKGERAVQRLIVQN